MYDFVIIGAGFAGSVLAERIANDRKGRVLIIDARDHIGGNAYDCHDRAGILIHKYGPHIFHTDSAMVWTYVSQFTDWRPYQHRVLGEIEGQLVPLPFNLDSLDRVFPRAEAQRLSEKLMAQFGWDVKVPILKLRQAGDEDLQRLADFVYDKVFLNYTRKQWGMAPEDLDGAVTARVPIRISRDDRYFQDRFQGIPLHGYTALFQRLLAHPHIHLMLGLDAFDVLRIDPDGAMRLFGHPYTGHVIYTGPIDAFFGYELGRLPYRTLSFEMESLSQAQAQPVAVVNYPNATRITRITEYKHLTGQEHPHTTISREVPMAYDPDIPGRDIPYYPVPRPQNLELLRRYQEKAAQLKRVSFVGRLAEYRYYDMHAIVARALKLYRDIIC